MDNPDTVSKVVPLRRTPRLAGPSTGVSSIIVVILRPVADRVISGAEAESLRAQLPAGGLERTVLEQYLGAQSYGWRCRILCSHPWLVLLLEALPPQGKA